MVNHSTQVIISVVIPVYNVSQYLSRCIDSVLKQDFNDYEVILVNDGSTDGSGVICDEYASNNNIIKVIHKENGGLSSARLAGYRAANGKFICFIDSDDYIRDNYLSDLYKCIIENNAQMSICAYSYEKDDKQTDHLLPVQDTCLTNIKEDFVLPIVYDGYESHKMLPNFIWLKMISKDIITEDLFVSEREVYQEDLVFNLLISDRIERISIINKPNYVYCDNGASLTKKYRTNAWAMQVNLYNTIIRFCVGHGYEVESLQSKRLINTIVFTVRNAAKADYKTYLSDLDKIVDDRMFKLAIKKFRFLSAKNKTMAIFLFLKLNQKKLLYKLLNRK